MEVILHGLYMLFIPWFITLFSHMFNMFLRISLRMYYVCIQPGKQPGMHHGIQPWEISNVMA